MKKGIFNGHGRFGEGRRWLAVLSMCMLAVSVCASPDLFISPKTCDFSAQGSVPTGQTSPELNVTIQNAGDATLTFSNISVMYSSEFTIVGGANTSPLASGASRVIPLTFTPTATGTRSGQLVIQSNDAVNPYLAVALSGVGIANTAPTAGINGAIRFNPNARGVLAPGPDLANQSFSIEFWTKRASEGSDAFIISMGNDGNDLALHIGFRGNNNFTFAFWGDDMDVPGMSDTNWHHWAVTYEAGVRSKIVYRDGVQVGSSTPNGNFQGSGTLYIGTAWNGGWAFYNGSLDEIRIWRGVVRSQAEIAANMNARLKGSETGLIAYYRMDEGTGTCLTDSSLQGRNAVLNNGAWTWVTGVPGAGSDPVPPIPTAGLAGLVDRVQDSVITLGVNLDTESVLPRAIVTALPAAGKGDLYQYNNGTRGAQITATPTTVVDTFNRVIYVPSAGMLVGDVAAITFLATDGYANSAAGATLSLQISDVASTVSQSSLNFLRLATDSIATRSVVLRNTSAGTLNTVRVGIVGAGLSDTKVSRFTILSDTGEATLAPGAERTVVIGCNATQTPDNLAGVLRFVTDQAPYMTDVLMTAVTESRPEAGAFPANNCLSLDGGDDYLSVNPPVNPIDLTGKSWSFEVWARPTSLSGHDHYVLGQGAWGNANNTLHIGYRSNAQFTFTWWTNDMNTPSFWGDQNQWHHWAGTFNPTGTPRRKLYRDGVMIQSDDPPNYGGSGELRIGAALGANTNWQGQLDEVRIWYKELSGAEVQSGMNARLTGSEANLAGYWRMDENGGLTAADSTPNARHATLVNGPLWTPNSRVWTPNAAVGINGEGGRGMIEVANEPFFHNLGTSGQAFTVECWVNNPGPDTWRAFVAKRGEGQGWQLRRSGGNVASFTFRSGWDDLWGATPINDGRWHHLAGVFEPGSPAKAYLYFDGKLDAFWSGNAGGSTCNDPVSIGGRREDGNYNGQMQGSVQDVRIWSVARTESQIRANMVASLTGSEADLMGYWPMDEGTGTTVLDKTANGNNGTFVGNAPLPAWIPDRSDWRWAALANPTIDVDRAKANIIPLPGTDVDANETWFASIATAAGVGTMQQYVLGAAGADITAFPAALSDPKMRLIYLPPAPAPALNDTTTFTYYLTDGRGQQSFALATMTLRFVDSNLQGSSPAEDFGLQVIGEAPVTTKTIIVTNNSATQTVPIYSLVIGGADPGEYAIAQDTGEVSLAPGATRTIQIVFIPTVYGTRHAQLRMQSSDPSILTVDLTGFADNRPMADMLNLAGLNFDGSGSIELPNETYFHNLGSGSQPMTVECWFRTTAANGWGNVMVAKNGEADGGWQLREGGNEGGKVACFTWRYDSVANLGGYYGDIQGTTFINDGLWHHVAGVYTGSAVQLYIDGKLDGAATGVSAPGAVVSDPVVIGARKVGGGVGANFNGSLDEVRIWSVARSAQEIKTNMKRSLKGDEAGLMGYWRMDEGMDVYTGDSSIGGNPGGFTGGVSWRAPAQGLPLLMTANPLVEVYSGIANTVKLNIFEPDGDTTTATIEELPAIGTLTQVGGAPITAVPTLVTDAQNRVVYTPPFPLAGATSATFRYRVADGIGYYSELTPTMTLKFISRFVDIAPDMIAFGTGAIGEPPATHFVTIANSGVDPLGINSITLVGANAGDFFVIADTGQAVLPGGTTRTVTVAFAPQTFGAKTAALRITTNDMLNPSKDIALSGSGDTRPVAGTQVAGGAISFTATSQTRVAVTSTTVYVANKSFSFEVWAKRASLGGESFLFGQGEPNVGNNCLHIGFRPSNVFTFAFWGNDVDTPSAYTDLDWHHWAVTYDSATKKQIIYRDGALIVTRTAGANYQSSGTLYIGAIPDGRYFDGAMDEARVWVDKVRTPIEIVTDMRRRLNGDEAGLAAYWRMDQANGAVVADATANNNTGVHEAAGVTSDAVYVAGPQVDALPQASFTAGASEDTSAVLTITGYDRDLGDIVVPRLLSLPVYGALYQYDEVLPGNMGTLIVSTGTQVSDPAYRLVYQPLNRSANYAETLTWDVNDGALISDNVAIYTINVNANSDPLTVLASSMKTAKGTTRTISQAYLNAVGDEPVQFQITSAPANGFLTFDGSTFTLPLDLTPADIAASKLKYTHDDSWTDSDRFNYSVSDGDQALSACVFLITVSLDTTPTLIANTGTAVTRGLNVQITPLNLMVVDSPDGPDLIVYTLYSVPTVGYLRRGATSLLDIGTTFTQQDINSGRMYYYSYNIPAGSDEFTFMVHDSTGHAVPGGPFTFPIEITARPASAIEYWSRY